MGPRRLFAFLSQMSGLFEGGAHSSKYGIYRYIFNMTELTKLKNTAEHSAIHCSATMGAGESLEPAFVCSAR